MLSENMHKILATQRRERMVFDLYEMIVVIILIVVAYGMGMMTGEIQTKSEAVKHDCAMFDKSGQFVWNSKPLTKKMKGSEK